MRKQLYHADVFDRMPAPLLILSPDLFILDANQAYLQATMTDRERIVGRYMFEVFPDNPGSPGADGVRSLWASFQRVLAGREADAMPRQRYDIRKPDRRFEERFWDPLNTPVLTDGDHVSLILHQVKDVTEQVRRLYTEQGLRRMATMAAARAERGRIRERTSASIAESRRMVADSERLIDESWPFLAGGKLAG